MDLVQTVRKEGSRGGRADFKWEDVKQDAQRENYLGHSLMAPVGRWQQRKDLNWYAKGDGEDDGRSAAEKLAEEKRKLKEAEEDAMLRAMGLPVPERASTNANLTPLGGKAHEADVEKALEEKAIEGASEEKRKDRKERSKRHGDDEHRRERRRRHRSRSRSRDRRDRRRERSRSRERTREKDRGEDRRRHRSKDHDHRRRDDRDDRRRDRRSKDRSPDRDRDRHVRRRSRSPYERPERRRD